MSAYPSAEALWVVLRKKQKTKPMSFKAICFLKGKRGRVNGVLCLCLYFKKNIKENVCN